MTNSPSPSRYAGATLDRSAASPAHPDHAPRPALIPRQRTSSGVQHAPSTDGRAAAGRAPRHQRLIRRLAAAADRIITASERRQRQESEARMSRVRDLADLAR